MIRSRFFRVWALLLFAYAAALCFVPLLNLLAFEFAFAVGLPITFMAAHAGWRARRQHPVWRAWRAALTPALALCLVPLVPITLNALRVQNCDYGGGLAVYVVLPGITAVVASGWGVALGGLRRPALAFVGVFLASLLLVFFRFWLLPPVDVYHPFLGYYPGSIYDEHIDIGGRLIQSRLEDLAWAALVVTAANRRLRDLGLAALAVAATMWTAYRHDVHRTAAYIQAQLGGLTTTDHARIYHPADWPEDKRTALALDVEFAWTRLTAFTGKSPTRPMQVYFYRDQKQKKRLMGAGRTRIAKPWQYTVHLHSPRVGQPVLTHELAHVFSAEISDAPHHLSLYRGVLPNMGLIEGFAVAATWEGGRLDPDQWSAALQRLGLAPDIQNLLAPTGFLATNSRTGYTLCGSFMNYIHKQSGPSAVEAIYRTGHFDDFAGLRDAWKAQLAEIELDPVTLAHAKARFDRPAIFGKVCAHEIAALRAQVAAALKRGDRAAALDHVNTILGFIARDVNARLQRVGLLYALKQPGEAAAQAQAIVDDPKAGAIARVRAQEWLADLAALAGDPQAANTYAALREQAFDRGVQRRLAVKLAAVNQGEIGREVLNLLLGNDTEPEREARYQRLTGSDWPVARYLVARWHANKDRLDQAEPILAALRDALPDPALTFEVERLRAALAFAQKRYPESADLYDALAARDDLGILRGERYSLEIWADRARFFGLNSR